jgi:hypothetical protein
MSAREETLKAAVLLVGAMVSVSCGPIQSTAILFDTETMLEAARTAQAEKLAPYEWTAAKLYLAKSKEEIGSSEYEVAVGYGRKALDFATRARDVAMKGGRRGDTSSQPTVGPR